MKVRITRMKGFGRTPPVEFGKPAITLQDAPQLAAAAFAGTVGIDADPVDLSDGGSAWVSVLAITPRSQSLCVAPVAIAPVAYNSDPTPTATP